METFAMFKVSLVFLKKILPRAGKCRRRAGFAGQKKGG
jgi:hypothetical protein